MGGPELIYCADGNPEFAQIAVESGWLYGARLPATVYQPVYFADQDWRNPDLVAYRDALAQHRPRVATVLDWEQESQESEVMGWCEEISTIVDRIVVIPKVPGTIPRIPTRFGDAEVVLGYSVPTSYGGTTVPVWEFGRRPVHLLGGSPQRQRELSRYLHVVSVDGNMAAQQSRRGRTWTRRKTERGHWQQGRSVGIGGDRPASECFRRSLDEISLMWRGR